MSEPFLGEIQMFGGTFAPRGWALCDGQLLGVSQYDALFSLFGTIYGGDGRTTFGLPDLRGRLPIHWGNGPGLSPRPIGQKGGVETVTLNTNEIPSHTHTLRGLDSHADDDDPAGRMPARAREDVYSPQVGSDPTVAMAVGAINPAGGNQPHSNLQPFQCVNFIVALTGIYPSRN